MNRNVLKIESDNKLVFDDGNSLYFLIKKNKIEMIKTFKLFESIYKTGKLNFINADTNHVISTINIETVDDDLNRKLGLMGRPELDPNSGMLFIMDREVPQSFWMKNTFISLDIIYCNSKKEIVSIQKNCQPQSLKSIPSIYPSLYVVEVNAGYTDKNGIFVGDKISF